MSDSWIILPLTMFLTTSLLILLVYPSSTQVIDQDDLDKFGDVNREVKLHKDLLRDYDSNKPPETVTTVRIRFILKKFNFDSEESLFKIYSWIIFSWNDERLKWNPDEHGGIKDTEFMYIQIWMPVLEQKSGFEYKELGTFYPESCYVHSSGKVECLEQRGIMMIECLTNLTEWPYDLQSCYFTFGPYSHSKYPVVFTFNGSRGMSLFGAEYGNGWDIIDFESGENKTELYLHFVVERKGVGLATSVIAPSVVLSVLTISSLFLDTGYVRSGIANLSLLCHFRFVYLFSELVPKHGTTTPSALRYLNVSMVLTTISVGLSFILISLRRRSVTPPGWMCTVNEFVFKGVGKFLIWPRWKPPKCESIDTYEVAEAWTDFANILNSVAIVVSVIVYQSTYLALVPHERPWV